jgi:hypothetical protein
MKNTARLISHMTLRRTVGIIGISFPFILLLGSIIIGDCREVQTHMSAYYHTSMRDPFVGIYLSIANCEKKSPEAIDIIFRACPFIIPAS